MQRTILELKKAGFGVAIDNFGAGYSSLALLATTEADMLKLDENFLEPYRMARAGISSLKTLSRWPRDFI